MAGRRSTGNLLGALRSWPHFHCSAHKARGSHCPPRSHALLAWCQAYGHGRCASRGARAQPHWGQAKTTSSRQGQQAVQGLQRLQPCKLCNTRGREWGEWGPECPASTQLPGVPAGHARAEGLRGAPPICHSTQRIGASCHPKNMWRRNRISVSMDVRAVGAIASYGLLWGWKQQPAVEITEQLRIAKELVS